MKTLYIECKMGAAGDMLMAGLYELLDCTKQREFLDTMNGLFQEYNIVLSPNVMQKCGITGTKMNVRIHGMAEVPDRHHDEHGDHHHAHSSYSHILHQISHLSLPDEVKGNAATVYKLIGEAEAKVHQVELDQIHFHEVGTLDALADVVGCCLLFHMLSPDQILCSPIHVGSGTVRCAHGILPVPAPATAEILKGVPIYSGKISSELCTPTGAAILAHFGSNFGAMPTMSVEKIGYGMGTRDFPQANCVRIYLASMGATEKSKPKDIQEIILELSCNLDDITGEALAFASEQLLKAGALDVFTTATTMKKSRAGFLLTCICNPEQEEILLPLIFTHTTTRGVRVKECRRYKLDVEFQAVSTPYGDIPLKISHGYGATRIKPEYDAVAAAAEEHGVDFQTVCQQVLFGS